MQGKKTIPLQWIKWFRESVAFAKRYPALFIGALAAFYTVQLAYTYAVGAGIFIPDFALFVFWVIFNTSLVAAIHARAEGHALVWTALQLNDVCLRNPSSFSVVLLALMVLQSAAAPSSAQIHYPWLGVGHHFILPALNSMLIVFALLACQITSAYYPLIVKTFYAPQLKYRDFHHLASRIRMMAFGVSAKTAITMIACGLVFALLPLAVLGPSLVFANLVAYGAYTDLRARHNAAVDRYA